MVLAPAGCSLLVFLLSTAPHGVVAADLADQSQSVPPAKERTPETPATEREKALEAARDKLDKHLLEVIDKRRGRPAHASRAGARVRVDDDGRALVDIRARMIGPLARKIERLKGRVVRSSLQYGSLVAWVPLDEIETLATASSILSIDPAPKSITDRIQVR